MSNSQTFLAVLVLIVAGVTLYRYYGRWLAAGKAEKAPTLRQVQEQALLDYEFKLHEALLQDDSLKARIAAYRGGIVRLRDELGYDAPLNLALHTHGGVTAGAMTGKPVTFADPRE